MKPQYLQPTDKFNYVIRHRLHLLAEPRFVYEDKGEGMPPTTAGGIRKSAVTAGPATDRLNEVSYPYVRRLVLLKRAYKKRFSKQRLDRIEKLLELSNATCYSKLANCQIEVKKSSTKKKRGWTDSDWKKHMDLIGPMAVPKAEFQPPPVERGPTVPLESLLARVDEMAAPPEHKLYRPLSQESWYRDPVKVSKRALKYKPTDRMKQLAIPKPIPNQD